jgi:hypothetical protein
MTVAVVGRIDELKQELLVVEAHLPWVKGKMIVNLDPSCSVPAHVLDCRGLPDEYTTGLEDDACPDDSGIVDAGDFQSSAGCLFDAKHHSFPDSPLLDVTGHSESSDDESSLSEDALRAAPTSSVGRQVQFVTDDNDRVVEQVFRYRAVSERRKERCYMSKTELGEAVEQANQFAKSYATMHEDWHSTVESLLLSSCSSNNNNNNNNNNGSGEDGDNNNESVDENVVVDDDDNEAILILTESSARGLEYSSRLLQKHQEWANRSVLRRYHQLAGRAHDENTRCDMAELLRERCEHVNRFTRHLAYQLARGDAIQARIVYEQDGTWDRWGRTKGRGKGQGQ